MIVKVALRNILRHKRRTLLSAATIAAGALVFMFLDSIMSGLDKGMIANMVDLSTGSLKIQTREYFEKKKSSPLNHGLENRDQIAAFCLADRRVRGVTCRTLFLGQLSNYSETMPVSGTVIDAATDSAVFALHRYLEGEYFGADNNRQIILGKKLAADLGVAVGDNITLYALTRYDSRNADEFKIVGLLNTTDPALNFSSVYITNTAAEEFLDLGGLVTELDVSLASRPDLRGFVSQLQELQASVKNRFPSLVASTFLELGAGILEMSRTRKAFGAVFLLVILLIAAVGIFNTVFMSVYERIREIGVLRAHGLRPGQLSGMFLLEGSITGLIGSALGLALGCLLNLYLVTWGYPLDKIAGEAHTSELPFYGTAYGQWNPEMIATVFCAGIVVATVAAVLPALRAAKIQVTQALRFV
jgi:ABC-type lipoprotein release transport system permease subunit